MCLSRLNFRHILTVLSTSWMNWHHDNSVLSDLNLNLVFKSQCQHKKKLKHKRGDDIVYSTNMKIRLDHLCIISSFISFRSNVNRFRWRNGVLQKQIVYKLLINIIHQFLYIIPVMTAVSEMLNTSFYEQKGLDYIRQARLLCAFFCDRQEHALMELS